MAGQVGTVAACRPRAGLGSHVLGPLAAGCLSAVATWVTNENLICPGVGDSASCASLAWGPHQPPHRSPAAQRALCFLRTSLLRDHALYKFLLQGPVSFPS